MLLELMTPAAVMVVEAGSAHPVAAWRLAQTGGGGGAGGNAASSPTYHCNVPGACPQMNVGGQGGAGGAAIGSRTAAATPVGARVARVRHGVSQGVHNIRSGPGSTFGVVASVPAGAAVQFIGSCRPPEGGGRSDWCRVSWKGKIGWSSMSGLELSK